MTTTPSLASSTVCVIGAGPAGLMAAEYLASCGHRVTLHDRMPSVGRKFLMAGRGGLNLTHSEDLTPFLGRYGSAATRIAPWLDTLSPQALIQWANDLGQETFTGSSGRVFPKAMKASPLLRAWLARLESLGVQFRVRSHWTGWKDGALSFDTPTGEQLERPDAVILALGGASWAKLGSDGAWMPWLEADGTAVVPFRPANVGFSFAWSPQIRDRFAGHPLKGIALTHGETTVRGEAMIARYGLEGGGVYALSSSIRDAIERDGQTDLVIDLRPDISRQALTQKLLKPRGKDSLSNWLRKTLHLEPAAIALLREAGPLPTEPGPLASRIKSVTLTLTGTQGLTRAISSAGGVDLNSVDDTLMLKSRPGTFVAGEMLDWEAPTGGYLLQASFASGLVAAKGVQNWLARTS